MPQETKKIHKHETSTKTSAKTDAATVTSLEELINMAIGPQKDNRVNYKLVQAILHILARQLRFLDQQVEIRNYEDHSAPHNKTEYNAENANEYGKREDKQKDERERKTSSSSGIDTKGHGGSIAVVNLSQFELLVAEVKRLEQLTKPIPFPSMPDNQSLRDEIIKGSASLTDTMEIMKVSARVQAMEAAISQMAKLLAQLSAVGGLPQNVATKFRGIPSWRQDAAEDEDKSTKSRVTRQDLDNALSALRDSMTKTVSPIAAKLKKTVEEANTRADIFAEQLNNLPDLNKRIPYLFDRIKECSGRLSECHTKYSDKLLTFGDQFNKVQAEVKNGIKQLENARAASETEAVKKIFSRFEVLVAKLDGSRELHKKLDTYHSTLVNELEVSNFGHLTNIINAKILRACKDVLEEQKSTRLELLDGLWDKADVSRLSGMVSMKVFRAAQDVLDKKLENCHDHFDTQEKEWFREIKHISKVKEGKSDLINLLCEMCDTEKKLRLINEKLRCAALELGNPENARLTHKLSKDGYCGACFMPAVQETMDEHFGKPPKLPPTCLPLPKHLSSVKAEGKLVYKPLQLPDVREHVCHRWVGGSHTVLTGRVARTRASPTQFTGPSTRKYTGYGDDHKLYMLEEAVDPCLECNRTPFGVQAAGAEMVDGAGDTGAIY